MRLVDWSRKGWSEDGGLEKGYIKRLKTGKGKEDWKTEKANRGDIGKTERIA
jgi:hypothetical protein